MRKMVIIAAGVAVLGAPVCVFGTGFGSVVSSFKSPSGWPFGMSYRPGQLYISAYCGHVVWRTTTTGSVINYHPLKKVLNYGITVGKAGGRVYYWVVDQGTGYIYRYIDNSSTIHGSFPVPGTWRTGVTFVDGTHMYYTDAEGATLYLLHPFTGSVYASYGLGFIPGDLAYDKGGYLWITNPENRSVYKCNLTGSPLASFTIPSSYRYPQACAFDGEYVWLGANDPPAGVYFILKCNIYEHPSVVPASAGKVKALFR